MLIYSSSVTQTRQSRQLKLVYGFCIYKPLLLHCRNAFQLAKMMNSDYTARLLECAKVVLLEIKKDQDTCKRAMRPHAPPPSARPSTPRPFKSAR